MAPTEDYWIERRAQALENALTAVNAKHRDVYLRLLDTYESLVGRSLSQSKAKRLARSIAEQGAQEICEGFASQPLHRPCTVHFNRANADPEIV